MPEGYSKMTTKMGIIFACRYSKNFAKLAIEEKG